MSKQDFYEEEDYGYSSYSRPRRRRPKPPKITLDTERKLWKMILFGLLTFGIYTTFMYYRMQVDLNIMESRHDGKRTMSIFLVYMLTPVTLGIASIVWMHKFCTRIGEAIRRRDIDYKFGSGTFWGWNVFGILLFGIGPFIFLHKLCKSMNLLAEDFNEIG